MLKVELRTIAELRCSASDDLCDVAAQISISGARQSGQVEGGRKMQMTRMAPASSGRMHTCIRLSLDSRRGKVAGTTTEPCFEVTIMVAFCVISTWSTGAQSMP